MGRMADARRKARRAADAPPDAGEPRPPEPPGAAPSSQPESEAPPLETPAEAQAPATDFVVAAPDVAPAEADGERLPAASDFLFDDEPEQPRARRVLPSSGLAEDILRAEATAEEPEPQPADAAALHARAHQFTFFAAPEREGAEQPEATEHLVTFLVGREEYGVDVRLVQEIIRVPAITPVPRAPAFARGVINLRGRIIPVMDFAAKLGLPPADAAQRKARILVVRLQARLIGLLVDGASQVMKVPLSSIEAAPEEVAPGDTGHIRGVAKLHDRLVILVDLARILAAELHAAGAAS